MRQRGTIDLIRETDDAPLSTRGRDDDIQDFATRLGDQGGRVLGQLAWNSSMASCSFPLLPQTVALLELVVPH